MSSTRTEQRTHAHRCAHRAAPLARAAAACPPRTSVTARPRCPAPRARPWPGAAGGKGRGRGGCPKPLGSLPGALGMPAGRSAFSGEAGVVSQPHRHPKGAGTVSARGRLRGCLPLAGPGCCPSPAGSLGFSAGIPRLAGRAHVVAMPRGLAAPAAFGYQRAAGTCAGSGGDSTPALSPTPLGAGWRACCGAAMAAAQASGIPAVISAPHPFLPFPRSLQPEESPDGSHGSPHTSRLAAPGVFRSSTSQRLANARRAVLWEAAKALH